MARFLTIGERIHVISPVIRKALQERNPEPIIKRAREQIEAGAHYLDVNIGPADRDGEELMPWAVKILRIYIRRSYNQTMQRIGFIS